MKNPWNDMIPRAKQQRCAARAALLFRLKLDRRLFISTLVSTRVHALDLYPRKAPCLRSMFQLLGNLSGEMVYPCIPYPNGEDEGGQASSSLAVSTRWISVVKLFQSNLTTLAQGREENRRWWLKL
ncbi:hypothetical protein BHM03_00031476 [Ensete ventricosum]|uniref:Uncharacterized protein n=1 Tax=Ensete ventricosum TaxID=4639 RepID=A0A445MIF6_ENSVE|nr:hypothetical protein BHM03_00031476 [Ensete ventricosum]